MSDDKVGEIVDETIEYSERDTLTPTEHQQIKDTVFGDQFRRVLFSDTTYFVLGKYDGGPCESRLRLVEDMLNSRSGSYAFLMCDIPEAWEFWTTKFKILANRSTFIVPVLEDTDGSHHWEAGHIDQPRYRPKVHVLKRDYPTSKEEHARFSAMASHFVEILDRDHRVYHWETEAELCEQVLQLPA